jgi:hypothetical protein
MPFTAKPEVLSPRLKRGGKAFDDENLDLLAHVLDDFIRIPGTSIRFGLDGIVGFIGGIASCIIIVAAWVRGVSYATVARMIANVAIEVVVGSIPVLGDMFDIAWRANRRNYALLVGSVEEPRKHTMQSWLFLGILCLVLAGVVILPLLLFTWVFDGLFHALFGTSSQGLFRTL